MKCLSIVFAVVAIMAVAFTSNVASSAPAPPKEPEQQQRDASVAGNAALNTLFDELPEETHHAALENYRAKRATCDLASGFGVGSSLCAAHCLARRYRGGYCNSKAVCVCRR